MSERKGSRWAHFLMMLPFFLIGIAIPVYFYGFSGEGPPTMPSNSYVPPGAEAQDQTIQRSSPRDGIVGATRDVFDSTVDNYVSPSLSPFTIRLGVLAVLFIGGFFVVRLLLHLLSGAMGAIGSFLVHKAAGPLFIGFLAVGSTWGLHQSVANEFGLSWAAATISVTAAIATLLALAGVRVR